MYTFEVFVTRYSFQKIKTQNFSIKICDFYSESFQWDHLVCAALTTRNSKWNFGGIFTASRVVHLMLPIFHLPLVREFVDPSTGPPAIFGNLKTLIFLLLLFYNEKPIGLENCLQVLYIHIN